MKKIKDFLRQIMLLYKRLLYFIAKLLEKRDERTVIFEAYQGRSIACSPKALYMELLNNPLYDNYKFIWSLRSIECSDIVGNKNTEIVKFESFAYYRALARAKYWIFNSNTRPFLKPQKDQIFVQTWHGTPLKKIGCDVAKAGNAMTKLSDIEKIYEREAEKISYMVSPSEYCTEKFISAFHLKAVHKENCVLTLGYPRNDFLFHVTGKECKDIKSKLGIPQNKKVILYAPTFRDNKYSAKDGFQQDSFLNFDKAGKCLRDEYVILFRTHYFISGRIDLSKYKDFVFDVSDVEDINQLYVISDMLITDYSSVFFDYANLKRPIIFYMYDYEEYKNELRDFYLDVRELPGPVLFTDDEVMDAVKNVDKISEQYKEKYNEFCKRFCSREDGNAAKRVIEKVFKN